jgi:hypothetical protein
MRFSFLFASLAIWMPLLATVTQANARCDPDRLEQFLQQQAFEMPARSKIGLYASHIERYYDDRDLSRDEILAKMLAWERRWPERIYKFIRLTDFQETESGNACKVTALYRFLAYRPREDQVSAGIGSMSLVLADTQGNGNYRIVAEFGRVICRGLEEFARSRCP